MFRQDRQKEWGSDGSGQAIVSCGGKSAKQHALDVN